MYFYINGSTNETGSYHFTLPRTVYITDKTEVGLVDFRCSKLPAPLILLCNICENSVLDSNFLPILRRIDSSKQIYDNPSFKTVTLQEINHIKFNFVTNKIQNPQHKFNFSVTLCLRKK